MHILLLIMLCGVSAILGRLLLTREQVWKTIRVRIPVTLGLMILLVVGLSLWLVFAALCFIGGSFYGVANWALPSLIENGFDGVREVLSAIISGEID